MFIHLVVPLMGNLENRKPLCSVACDRSKLQRGPRLQSSLGTMTYVLQSRVVSAPGPCIQSQKRPGCKVATGAADLGVVKRWAQLALFEMMRIRRSQLATLGPPGSSGVEAV